MQYPRLRYIFTQLLAPRLRLPQKPVRIRIPRPVAPSTVTTTTVLPTTTTTTPPPTGLIDVENRGNPHAISKQGENVP